MSGNERMAWLEQVWTSLRSVPGVAAAPHLEGAWRAHQQRQRPVAVIFGAYDAGKSSLLKRLLFEEGVAIPDSLTVSGRRETFSVLEVDGATWTYRDTPGLAAGNAEHEQKALESLDLADLLLWVLPPQLVTGDKATFDGIATGARFAVHSDQVGASLMAVIARMDEAGIDASTNPRGYAALCAHKQTEFASLLTGIGAAQTCLGTIPVSADPYGEVGNSAPVAGSYGAGKGWDGMGELRAALESAAHEVDALRTFAGVRYASRVIRDVSDAIRSEQSGFRDARETLGNERDRLRLLSMSLEAGRKSARAGLDRGVEDALLSVSRTGMATAAGALGETLGAVIDRWGEQVSAEFETLVASADQEVAQRMRSPSVQRLDALLRDLNAPNSQDSRSGAGDTVRRYGSRIGSTLRDAFKGFVQYDLGMPIDEAAKRIRDFEQSGKTFAEFRAERGKGRTFSSEAEATKVSKSVKWVEAIDALAPLLDQLLVLALDIHHEMRSGWDADRKAQRRQEIRTAIQMEAEALKAEALTEYDDVTSAFSEWLSAQTRNQTAAEASLAARTKVLTTYETTIDALLRDRPYDTAIP